MPLTWYHSVSANLSFQNKISLLLVGDIFVFVTAIPSWEFSNSVKGSYQHSLKLYTSDHLRNSFSKMWIKDGDLPGQWVVLYYIYRKINRIKIINIIKTINAYFMYMKRKSWHSSLEGPDPTSELRQHCGTQNKEQSQKILLKHLKMH